MINQQNIISLLGIESLPIEKRFVIVSKVIDLVEKRLILKIMSKLKEKEKVDFLDLLEKNNKENIEQFMLANFPNYLELLEEEVLLIKSEMGDFVAKLE